MRFVLASASPTRLRVLRQAGFDPVVVVSGVDETHHGDAMTAVGELADRKAQAVAAEHPDAIVLGCDSLVELGDDVLGKPTSAGDASTIWRRLRGQTVRVWTGHCVMGNSKQASLTAHADVTFGEPRDDEIERYCATEEPLGAAGAFRLDGRAAAFIDAVVGDPGTVHGVSISVVRALLAQVDVEVAELWV